MAAALAESRLPTILCCVCAAPIKPNAANTCASCLQNQVDITEGIPKEVLIHQCRGCMKWNRPGWMQADLESRELLAMCLKKINNLNHVKLVDAGWIWTEPHSRRLKVKLTVQKEIMSHMILQQSFVVTFVVRNQQCDDCQASFTNHSWKAVVQVRQKVDHKRTFYFLEQLILKHRAHEKASNIEAQPDGVDFFFVERNHALRFVDFLQETIPMKLKTAKKLISADNHSNTQNYKFTYMVEIAPVCKDDLVVLPIRLARNLGNISPLCLVASISSSIHVVDPFTLQGAEIDSEKYWRDPFKGIRSVKSMTDFTVLDVTPYMPEHCAGRRIRMPRKSRLAEVEVARNVDFGVNDQRFQVVCHLGHLLHAGDTALGYDLTSAVFNDNDLAPLQQINQPLPDIILVKKQFVKTGEKRTRHWKLKKMEGVEQSEQYARRADLDKEAKEYEQFLDDLEEDRELRLQINLYKDQEVLQKRQQQAANGKSSMDLENNNNNNDDNNNYNHKLTIPLDELLDDLTVSEQHSEATILSEEQAAQQPSKWELEEL